MPRTARTSASVAPALIARGCIVSSPREVSGISQTASSRGAPSDQPMSSCYARRRDGGPRLRRLRARPEGPRLRGLPRGPGLRAPLGADAQRRRQLAVSATVVLRLETAVSCLGSVGYGSFTSTRPLVPVIQRRHKHQARARVGVEVAEPLDYYYTRSDREAAFVRAETFATEYHAGPTTTFSQQEGACAYDAVTPDTSINRSLHDGGF